MRNSNYKVIYTEYARQKLYGFLSYVRENCKYIDSGLHNESEIIEMYIKRYDDFINELLDTIEDRFANSFLLLGRKVEETNEKYELSRVILRLRSFSIIVKCKQIFDNRVIEIEDIIIRS